MLLSYSIRVLFTIKIKYIKLRIIYYYSIFVWLQKFDIYYETATVEPDKKTLHWEMKYMQILSLTTLHVYSTFFLLRVYQVDSQKKKKGKRIKERKTRKQEVACDFLGGFQRNFRTVIGRGIYEWLDLRLHYAIAVLWDASG